MALSLIAIGEFRVLHRLFDWPIWVWLPIITAIMATIGFGRDWVARLWPNYAAVENKYFYFAVAAFFFFGSGSGLGPPILFGAPAALFLLLYRQAAEDAERYERLYRNLLSKNEPNRP